jgi:two-component system OmpR family sensor kinase
VIINSIRWRIHVWYGLILVLVLGGFGVTAYQLQRRDQFRRVDDDLQRRLGGVGESLRAPLGERPFAGRDPGQQRRPRQGMRPPGPDDRRPPPFPGEGPRPEEGEPDFPDGPLPPPEEMRGRDPNGPPPNFRLLPRQALLFDQSDTNAFYYVVWSRTGEELARSSNAPLSIMKPQGAKGAMVGPLLRGSYRELAHIIPVGEVVLVGRSVGTELSGLRATGGWLAGAGGIILLLGLAGGWWLSSRALQPIDLISNTAAKIASGDLSQRIDTSDTESELGRLAGVLNSTFARLETAFQQQKQFTADAAHELRTPISVMMTQTQTALHRERSAPEYRETIEACLRAAQRMRKLVEALLELARIDAGQESLNCSDFDVAPLASECMREAIPLAEERGISLGAELSPASCHADRDRVSQVLMNLLSNAIHYNTEKGSVTLRSRRENGCVLLSVSDTGVGIPADELNNLFRRFYRVDKSRTAGRSGLGLAISKALVEAQGGAIEVTSEPGKGSTFTVRLPATET